jgi:hypothetical protein
MRCRNRPFLPYRSYRIISSIVPHHLVDRIIIISSYRHRSHHHLVDRIIIIIDRIIIIVSSHLISSHLIDRIIIIIDRSSIASSSR